MIVNMNFSAKQNFLLCFTRHVSVRFFKSDIKIPQTRADTMEAKTPQYFTGSFE